MGTIILKVPEAKKEEKVYFFQLVEMVNIISKSNYRLPILQKMLKEESLHYFQGGRKQWAIIFTDSKYLIKTCWL